MTTLELVRCEQGLETIEYAIVAGLIGTVTLAVIAAIAKWVQNRFGNTQIELGA